MARHTKINTTKSHILNASNLPCGTSIEQWLCAGASSPSRPLSAHVSPGAIKDANEAVRNASQGSSKLRRKYAKCTPEQNASIGEYASLHGSYSSFFEAVGSRNEAYFGSSPCQEA